jgi:uncharacterized protein YkwD
MRKMFKNAKRWISGLVIVSVLCVSLFAPAAAHASTTMLYKEASIINALQAYLYKLFEHLLQLQERVFEFAERVYEEEMSEPFVTDLYYGAEGDEVKRLQIFLSENYPESYPTGLITGYFGKKTEEAVIAFQKDQGLPETGYVGALTRDKINMIIGASTATETEAGAGENEQTPGTELNETPESIPVDPAPAAEENDPSSEYVIEKFEEYDLAKIAGAVHEKVNEKRLEDGDGPLRWSAAAAMVAQEHSNDQGLDNIAITDPTKRCHYPLIRHEGFSFGFSVGDRMQERNVGYRTAGENIAMVPASKDLVYRYPADHVPEDCPVVESFPSGHWEDETAAYDAYRATLSASDAAIKSVDPVNWINKEWQTIDEIATTIVEGWMNSPGHRENMLRDIFTHGGIGIVRVNDYIIATHILYTP